MARELDASVYRAAIFRMGGVLTNTAVLHATAWKEMLDGFLATQAQGDVAQRHFDLVDDYLEFLDERPRLDGLEDFLEARSIYIPWGRESDPVGAETVHGLGKLKDRLFLDLLERRGVEAFSDAVLFAAQVRTAGLKSVIVTSSSNGRRVMERSGLLPLFDGIVDGRDAAERSLKRKPAPDLVAAAAQLCEVEPGEVVLFEDSVPGVQAGRAAGVRSVVGVAREGNEQQLQDAGAGLVVPNLAAVRLVAERPRASTEVDSARDASAFIEAVASNVARTAIFLDYDGTLTPIVERPDMAVLDERTEDVLRRLAERRTVAVVSGRSLQDVRSLVGVEGLFYAGSHGLEIATPDGEEYSPDLGRDYEALMDEIEAELLDLLGGVDGVLLEKKSVSLAVHFRLAPEAEPVVSEVVDRLVSRHGGLRRQEGKKVIEVRPDIDWDKGRALVWLMERLRIDPGHELVLYIGDDDTDEDAFRALGGLGIGIVVQDAGVRQTYADLSARNTDEVREFLETLC